MESLAHSDFNKNIRLQGQFISKFVATSNQAERGVERHAAHRQKPTSMYHRL